MPHMHSAGRRGRSPQGSSPWLCPQTERVGREPQTCKIANKGRNHNAARRKPLCRNSVGYKYGRMYQGGEAVSKPLVVGSIPYRPCQTREKKPMIAADLFANRFGVSWSEVSLVLYGPLARRLNGWLITGWPRFDFWMVHHIPPVTMVLVPPRNQPGRAACNAGRGYTPPAGAIPGGGDNRELGEGNNGKIPACKNLYDSDY